MAAGVTFIVLIVFGEVLAQVVLAQDQFRLEQLQTTSADQQAKYDRLRLQVAELEAPHRIVATAQQLGMIVPPGVTYLAPSADATPPAGTSTAPSGSPGDTGPGPASWTTVKSHLAAG